MRGWERSGIWVFVSGRGGHATAMGAKDVFFHFSRGSSVSRPKLPTGKKNVEPGRSTSFYVFILNVVTCESLEISPAGKVSPSSIGAELNSEYSGPPRLPEESRQSGQACACACCEVCDGEPCQTAAHVDQTSQPAANPPATVGKPRPTWVIGTPGVG